MAPAKVSMRFAQPVRQLAADDGAADIAQRRTAPAAAPPGRATAHRSIAGRWRNTPPSARSRSAPPPPSPAASAPGRTARRAGSGAGCPPRGAVHRLQRSGKSAAAAASASAATQIAPRASRSACRSQPPSGTPTSRVSDCPAITQPSARPRCAVHGAGRGLGHQHAGVGPGAAAGHGRPGRRPSEAPGGGPTPTRLSARPSGPPIRKGRRPQRSDPAPASSEATPQATEVIAIRLATSASEVSRSRAMSSRKGARVVPEQEAANMPRQQATSSAQGMRGSAASGVFVVAGGIPEVNAASCAGGRVPAQGCPAPAPASGPLAGCSVQAERSGCRIGPPSKAIRPCKPIAIFGLLNVRFSAGSPTNLMPRYYRDGSPLGAAVEWYREGFFPGSPPGPAEPVLGGRQRRLTGRYSQQQAACRDRPAPRTGCAAWLGCLRRSSFPRAACNWFWKNA